MKIKIVVKIFTFNESEQTPHLAVENYGLHEFEVLSFESRKLSLCFGQTRVELKTGSFAQYISDLYFFIFFFTLSACVAANGP